MPGRGCSRRETNLSAEPYSTKTGPWLPRADADSGWPGDHQAPQGKRAEAPGCLRFLQVAVRGGASRLRRGQRLRQSRDFRRVTQQGVRKASTHFIMIVAENQRAAAGLGAVLGVTVSKKVGRAVERNRVKRRIREWFRHQQTVFPEKVEVVVIARRGAAALGMQETNSELGSLLR